MIIVTAIYASKGDEVAPHLSLVYRQLLARLCLIREELSVVASDEGSSTGTSDFEEAKMTHQRLIPQGTAAFVKEMLGVSSKEKRYVTVTLLMPDSLPTFAAESPCFPFQKQCKEILPP